MPVGYISSGVVAAAVYFQLPPPATTRLPAATHPPPCLPAAAAVVAAVERTATEAANMGTVGLYYVRVSNCMPQAAAACVRF